MAVYLRISNLCDSKDEQQWLFIYGIPMRFFSLCHSLIPDPGTNVASCTWYDYKLYKFTIIYAYSYSKIVQVSSRQGTG